MKEYDAANNLTTQNNKLLYKSSESFLIRNHVST